MEYAKPVVCVLNASTYMGFWNLKGLLGRGFKVHAAIQHEKNGETEIQKREIEKVEEAMVVFDVDVLDYHNILVGLKGCTAMFCPDGYEPKFYSTGKTKALPDGCRGRVHPSTPDHATPAPLLARSPVLGLQTISI